jgi:hypothetical protein
MYCLFLRVFDFFCRAQFSDHDTHFKKVFKKADLVRKRIKKQARMQTKSKPEDKRKTNKNKQKKLEIVHSLHADEGCTPILLQLFEHFIKLRKCWRQRCEFALSQHVPNWMIFPEWVLVFPNGLDWIFQDWKSTLQTLRYTPEHAPTHAHAHCRARVWIKSPASKMLHVGYGIEEFRILLMTVGPPPEPSSAMVH